MTKNVSQLYFKSFVCNFHLYLKFCLLYAPGQVTYCDPHCGGMVKWSIIIVWPLPTLHHHTWLPGHTVTVDDYKYMDGHNNHCGSVSDKRNSTGTATFITLFDQDFNFRKLPYRLPSTFPWKNQCLKYVYLSQSVSL